MAAYAQCGWSTGTQGERWPGRQDSRHLRSHGKGLKLSGQGRAAVGIPTGTEELSSLLGDSLDCQEQDSMEQVRGEDHRG